MNHFTIHLKLIYYQSTIFQFKKKTCSFTLKGLKMGKKYRHMPYLRPWSSWERQVGNPSQGRFSISKVTEGNKCTDPLCIRDFP